MDNRKTVLILSFAVLFAVLFIRGPLRAEELNIQKKYFVPPPPFTPGIFPCSQCHQGMPANRHPRKLEMHQ
jgi:hypothetical protein